MMLASSTKHRREGDDKEDNNQEHEPDHESGEMIEITWREFKRMIFWGRKMYSPSIRLNQWVQQDLNWMTSYTVQYISNWHPFCHLQARNKQEPRIMRELWAIKSECKSRRVIEIGLPKPDAEKQMEIGSMQLMLQWLHEDASLTSSAHPAGSTIIP